MKLTHDDLIDLGTQLKHKNLEDGLCAGFTGMWLQAALAEDECSFYARLDFIATYDNNLPKLVAEIEKTRLKKNRNLERSDQQLLDVLCFFDGVQLYLHPYNFPPCLNVIQTNLQPIFDLTKSQALKNKKLEVLLDKDYCHTKESLTDFFKDLEQLLSQTPHPIPIRLGSATHAVCLKYNKTKSCWNYVDTSDFKRYPDHKKYERELNTESLVTSIFESFRTTKYAVFNTQLLTVHNVGEGFKENLNKLNSNYPIGTKQLHPDSNNATLFYIACQNGHTEIVQELLKPQYQTDIHKARNDGTTPFYIACQNGHTALVQELLKPDYKTDINKAMNEGATPFFIACYNGHTEIVKEFLKPQYQTNIHKAMSDGTTPFFSACQNGHIAIVQELLKPHYQTDIHKAKNDGTTPFFIACENGDTAIVRELLKPDYKTDINKAMNEGATPFFIACQNGHTAIVKELLKPHYQTDINKAMNDGTTPFFIACYNGHTAIVQELLKPHYQTDIHKAKNSGTTPFYIACQNGYTEIVQAMLRSSQFKQIDTVGITGHTPLLVACFSPHNKTLFQELLRHGADPTHKNDVGNTALDIAFYKKNETAIGELLEWSRIHPYPLASLISSKTLKSIINSAETSQYLPKLLRLMNAQELQTLFFMKYDAIYPGNDLTRLGLFKNASPRNLVDILQRAQEGNHKCKMVCINLGWLNQNGSLNLENPDLPVDVRNAYHAPGHAGHFFAFE